MLSSLISTLKVEDVLTRPKPLERATDAFKRITQELIKRKASKGATPYLDVVREVINLIPVHWLSNEIVR
jgi:linoleate 10R-lipoxygenase